MQLVLTVLGILLVGAGLLVLIRYSKAPGGTVKFLGLEVSSGGAGLPLIALGIGCVFFAANMKGAGNDGSSGGPHSDSTTTSVATTTSQAGPAPETAQAKLGGKQGPPGADSAAPLVVPAPVALPTADQVRTILAEHARIAADRIDVHRDLYSQSLGIEQIDVLETILQLEDSCKVTVPEDVANEKPISIDRLVQVLQELHARC